MRLGHGSCRILRGSFIGVLFLVSVMLAVLGLWLLRFLSLLPLVTRLPLLPWLAARPLRLLTLLVALLVLHRVVAALLPLILLLFIIGIHVGHAIYLLKKVVKQTIADEVPTVCATSPSGFSGKNKHCVHPRSTNGTAVPLAGTELEAVRYA
jgi:hypothetical protein